MFKILTSDFFTIHSNNSIFLYHFGTFFIKSAKKSSILVYLDLHYTVMKNLSFTIFKNEKFIDLTLVQFGSEQCAPGHSFGPASRNHYLFHYISSGQGKLWARNSQGDDDIYNLTAGQGFLIFPNQITTYIADEKNPWTYCWLEFDGRIAKEALELAGFSIDQPVYNSRDKAQGSRMHNEMEFIVDNSMETSFTLIGHLYLFLDAFIRSSRSTLTVKKQTLHDFYLKEAMNFIEINYQKNISVSDIADICGINRSYFGKLFHDYMGMTPQEFLLQYRMSKASKLLLMSDKSVEQIGKEVGYENQFHFSRAFKSVYGMSPLKWLKQNQTETQNPLDKLDDLEDDASWL